MGTIFVGEGRPLEVRCCAYNFTALSMLDVEEQDEESREESGRKVHRGFILREESK